MYRRRAFTPEQILLEYMQNMAPQDYEDLGINKSTIEKASNPNLNREISLKQAKKLERLRSSLGKPLMLLDWLSDGLNKPPIDNPTFEVLMIALSHAKREADDVSTVALELLADGRASKSDLETILNEATEAEKKFADVRRLVTEKLKGVVA